LGVAYRTQAEQDGRSELERRQYQQKAIEYFVESLQGFDPKMLPVDCLKTARNLGDLGFKEGMWDIAIQGYSKAIEAVEQTRSWATDDQRRQEILREGIGVYDKAIQACINNQELDRAFMFVERSRSRHLVELIATNDLYKDGNIPAQALEWLQTKAPKLKQLWEDYSNLQRAIDAQRQQQQGDDSKQLATTKRTTFDFKQASQEISALITAKDQIWKQIRILDPVLAGQLQVEIPNFSELQKLVEHNTTALLAFYTTADATYIFVMRQIEQEVKVSVHTCVHNAKAQSWENLQSWIGENWLAPYKKNQNAWINAMPDHLDTISQKLDLTSLIATHLQGIEELILVPYAYLHLIPFAALPISLPDSKTEYFGDRFKLRYAPSCQILKYCFDRDPISSIQCGTVEDAQSNLVYARFECEIIAQLLSIPSDHRLQQQNATVANFRKLATMVNLLHSSHHATSNLVDPLNSAIALADGEITMAELMSPDLRMPNLDEVFLSCCETNLGPPNITDDLLTLGTGFLAAGARAVISTLWSVDQLSTALFCVFYYQQRHQGIDRPTAIQTAQKQLRQLTGAELYKNYNDQLQPYQAEIIQQRRQQLIEKMANHDQKAIKTAKIRLSQAEQSLNNLYKLAHPFDLPFCWAPFICQGLA